MRIPQEIGFSRYCDLSNEFANRKYPPVFSGIFDGIHSDCLLNSRAIMSELEATKKTEKHSADEKAEDMEKDAQLEGENAAGLQGMTAGDAFYIAVTSLLQQFRVVKVRSDFVSGKFSMRPSSRLLDQLDELWCLLQPRWQGGGFMNNMPRCMLAVDHCNKLGQRSTDVVPLKTGIQKTYQQWFELLAELGNDPYWILVDPDHRCSHKPIATDFSRSPSEDKLTARSHKSNKGYGSSCSHTSTSYKSKHKGADSQNSGRSHNSHGKKSSKKPGKIEEIVISDSSVNVSSTSSSSSSSGSSVSPQRHRKSRNRTKLIKKSIVTPPTFEANGKLSLGEFLDDYEHYFDRKYCGNKYEKTQVLESFLSGELLQIFKIRGGRRLKFTEMKEHLLRYYKEQRIGTRKYWRRKLDEMIPEPAEPFDMFGLRLLETAKLGYNRSSEAAEAVRKPFLNQLPEYIKTKIKDAELLNAAQGRGKHLPFKSLMIIAKQSQVEGAKPKTVMWSSSALGDPVGPQSVQPLKSESCFENQSDNYKPTRKRHSPSPTQSRRPRSTCYHCHNQGHKKADCWIRQGRCRICGGAHTMENCPRYDPDYRSKSRARKSQGSPNQPLN